MVCQKKERESNIELLRIVLMLLIISHHYVVNSGVMSLIYQNCFSFKSIFLLIFGAWGKIGINCFLLITGYFMCTSKISLKKYIKLVLQVEFYKIIIFLILYLTGNETYNVLTVLKLFLPITSIKDNFVGCYLAFYLFIPFINILINNINKKQHFILVLLILFIYSILASIPKFNIIINYVSLFFLIYLIGAYIRLYSIKILENKRVCILITIITILFLISSIIIGAFIYQKNNINVIYYLFVDSNKISAIIAAILIFYTFKNIKIKYKFIINTIASSIFGVLLIHANSDAMRSFLWGKLLQVENVFSKSLIYVILHSIISVILIFTICVIIDQVRIKFLEYPLFKRITPKLDKIELKFRKKVVE